MSSGIGQRPDYLYSLSNACTATSLEQEITAGDNYTVPDDGYYLLGLKNSGSSIRSADFSINGANIIRNHINEMTYAVLPLKKGTVLTTRSNTAADDNFQYRVVSKFIV